MRSISTEPPWVVVGARGDDDYLQATLDLAATITVPDRILVVVPATDSAPAELIALAHALERDPLGRIVFLPTDPYVADGTLRDALRAASVGPARPRVSLLGATRIATGPITAFWDLVRAHLPVHAAWLERYIDAIGTPDEQPALAAAYAAMPHASFDRDLLAKADAIAVIPSAAATRTRSPSYSGCSTNQWNARYGDAAAV